MQKGIVNRMIIDAINDIVNFKYPLSFTPYSRMQLILLTHSILYELNNLEFESLSSLIRFSPRRWINKR